MKNYLFLLPLLLLGFISCNQPKGESANSSSVKSKSQQPAFKGDARAIAIADSIMMACGGQEAWDDTEYLQWNFFGSRRHIWNKKTNDLIIYGLKDNYEIKMNLNTMKGSVVYGNIPYTQPDTLQKYLAMGRDMWRNDSYWLILPFKLKDPGVTLKYLGDEPFRMLEAAHKIQLTFDSVGKTPNNKYVLTVDPQRKLIMQWDFYENFNDPKPKFSTPWFNYKRYGNIMLSDNRGENYLITEISTSESLADKF